MNNSELSRTSPLPMAWAVEWLRDYVGGDALSHRFKDAFRMALAVTLAYGISLAMDWSKGYWAVMAVIFCALATSGQSINAGIDRVLGTGLGAIWALILVALFPQDRWLFLGAMSVVVAACTYRTMAATPRKALWFNAGVNLPVIALLGEMGNAVAPGSFDTSILRVQQTAMGAVVYSLVAVLVWPERGDAEFLHTMCRIARSQRQVFTGFLMKIVGGQPAEDPDQLLAETARKLPQLRAGMEGAVYDNPRLGLTADAWIRHLAHVKSLHLAQERWHTGLTTLQDLSLCDYLPNLDAYRENIERSLQGVEALLSHDPPAGRPDSLELEMDEDRIATLSPIQRAALLYCRDQLILIDELARAQFDTAEEIANAVPTAAGAPGQPIPQEKSWVFDLDWIAAVIRQQAGLWIALVVVIYVPDVPLAVALIAMSNAFGMGLVSMPQLSAAILFKPILMGCLMGGFIYMFIMPHLSSFEEVGGLLFAVAFAITYAFQSPVGVIIRSIALTFMVLILQIDNFQTYHFSLFGSWLVEALLFTMVLVVASRVPISFDPKVQFQWQFRRFWQSAAFLMSDLAGGHADQRFHGMRRAFHGRQLALLPSRMRVFAGALAPTVLEDEDRGRINAAEGALDRLSYRLQDLGEAYPDVVKLSKARQLHAQGVEIREKLCELFDALAHDPAVVGPEYCQALIEELNARLEVCAEELLKAEDMTREKSQQVYRVLGAYQGLLQAVGEALKSILFIDWARLREARL